jgi:hypothetical protein
MLEPQKTQMRDGKLIGSKNSASTLLDCALLSSRSRRRATKTD